MKLLCRRVEVRETIHVVDVWEDGHKTEQNPDGMELIASYQQAGVRKWLTKSASSYHQFCTRGYVLTGGELITPEQYGGLLPGIYAGKIDQLRKVPG
jgi:hypothetical protein